MNEKLKIEDLVEGDIYHFSRSVWDYGYITAYKKEGFLRDENEGKFNKYNIYQIYDDSIIRLPTKEERNWFERCKKVGRTISLEEANNLMTKEDELTNLPENWCIKLTKDNIDFLKTTDGVLYNKGYSYTINAYYSKNKGRTHKEDDMIEISLEQFKKWVLKEEEDKFIVGKWYKVKNDTLSYKKFLKLKDDKFYWSEEIYEFSYGIKHSIHMDWMKRCTLTLLEDLSEIQEFLPDGHVDKFKPKEVMKFKKDDYIVTLKVSDDIFTSCAKDNYCFKLYSDGTWLHVYKTLSGWSNDWNSNLKYDKSNKLLDWRYATAEEIAEYDRLDKPYDVTTLKSINKEPTIEEILEICKKKYPIGCKFKNARNPQYNEKIDNGKITIEEGTLNIFGDGNYIYYKGNYAEILELPKITPNRDELLAKARRDYPVGTRFKNPISNNIHTINKDDFQWGTNNNIMVSVKEYIYDAEHSCCYIDNQWATIIEEPKPKFKVGDKVQIIKDSLSRDTTEFTNKIGILIGGKNIGGDWYNENEDYTYKVLIKNQKVVVAEIKLIDEILTPIPQLKESTENFSIKYNNEEEYDLIVKWCKDRNISSLGILNNYKDRGTNTILVMDNKEWWVATDLDYNGYPLKSLSDLGISLEGSKSMVSLGVIGEWKNREYPKTPDECYQPIKHQQPITTNKAKGKKVYILPQLIKSTN